MLIQSFQKNIGIAVLFTVMSFTGYGQHITTVAGDGTTGFAGDGGSATAAKLYFPFSVAIDKNGNIYIGDQVNNRIRKVTTSGTISTIAGTGGGGYSGDGGAATAAQIDYVQGVAVDDSGNVYVADADNDCIRKINSAGTISTIAGNTTGGYSGDGGLGTHAQLNFPKGVAVDKHGNVYFADYGNNCIRKITPTDTITTIAGNGTAGFTGDGSSATSAELNAPVGVAVDDSNNIYIADYGNNRIRKVNTSGKISTIAGNGTAGFSGDGSMATTAELNNPTSVAVDDSGNVYISDFHNDRIRKIAVSGKISTIAGTGTSGYSGDGGMANTAELAGPTGVAVDKYGDVFIADQANNRIRELGPNVTEVKNVSGLTVSKVVTYPNPTHGSLHIFISSVDEKQVQATITNALGKTITQCTIPTNKDEQVHICGIPGVYFVSLIVDGKQLTSRIIVN